VISWPDIAILTEERAMRSLEFVARASVHEKAIVALKMSNMSNTHLPFPTSTQVCKSLFPPSLLPFLPPFLPFALHRDYDLLLQFSLNQILPPSLPPSLSPSLLQVIRQGNLDVFWLLQDGGIMILLAYLLQRNATWRLTTLRIFTFVQKGQDVLKTEGELAAYLQALRIKAEVKVISLEVEEMGAYGADWTVRRERRGEGTAAGGGGGGEGGSGRKLRDMFLDPAMDGKKDTNGSSSSSSSTLPPPLPSLPHRAPAPAQGIARATFDEGSKIQQAILENSRDSALVLLNLPPPPKSSWLEPLSYFRLVEHLTGELSRVVLVYGSGAEVLSTRLGE
jgi:hypothetical protein